MSLPSGIVTFLLTDLEGSTRLWEANPAAMQPAIARHDSLAAAVIAEHGGWLLKSRGEGDSLFAVFARATDALAAALTLQRAFLAEPWPAGLSLRVRMALHTGEADLRDGDYFGAAVTRCARLRAAAHGGQVLVSGATQELVRDTLPEATALLDRGEHRLRDLARPEHVFQLLHPGLPAEFPPLKSLESLPNNLPQQTSSFIGREREMAEVKALLKGARLLTLTGSGGCGKTRLSLQVAADVLEEFPDGVWLIELAPLADPALVPQALALALGVKEEGGKSLTQGLIEFLRPRRLLLLLDNCEHLLEACARLVDTLLRACPSLKTLASSREGLGVAGEQTYRVPSLSLPDPGRSNTAEVVSQYEAVRLFIERARLNRPDFTLTNQDAPALARLCHRLDGIPLALELAAARVRSLSVEEIGARLDNRFRLLTGGSRTALPRQQTLRALIDWSWDLLSAPEKTLLHRLSVFSGGWTLEAAERVCVGEAPSGEAVEDREVLDLLTGLVDKSLALAESREGGTRYRLLETVRQYARDRLLESGEAETLRGRHRDGCVAFAEEAEAALSGPEQAVWYERLEIEHDNLRAAMEWSLADPDGAEAGLRLVGALGRFWEVRGHIAEGRALATSMLTRPGAERRTPARAKALYAAGLLAALQYDFEAATRHVDESLAIYQEAGDRAGEAALLMASSFRFFQADAAAARAYVERSLALRREMGDLPGLAECLIHLGDLAWSQGEAAAARRLMEEALGLNRRLGNSYGVARTLRSLAEWAVDQENYGEACPLLEAAAAIQKELGDRRKQADYLQLLANLALAQGDVETAGAAYEASAALFRELDDDKNLAYIAMLPGHILLEQGNMAGARARYEEGLALRRKFAPESTGWALLELGHAAWCQGDFDAARSCALEAASVSGEQGHRESLLAALESLAAVAGGRGDKERAARLWGAADGLRQSLDIPVTVWWRRSRARIRAAAGAEVLEGEAFAPARADGRAMRLEQAVLCAIEGGAGGEERR